MDRQRTTLSRLAALGDPHAQIAALHARARVEGGDVFKPRESSDFPIGTTFHGWTLIGATHFIGPRRKVLCRCKCGVERLIDVHRMKSGRSKSCGCDKRALIGDAARRHGGHRSKEYGSWCRMIARCTNEKNKNWRYYGGRGIKVCDEWLNSFTSFFNHIGPASDKSLTIERIDNNGGYEPGNVRWATQKEQCRNRRNNKFIEAFGKRQCIADWCSELGLSKTRVGRRVHKGLRGEEALFGIRRIGEIPGFRLLAPVADIPGLETPRRADAGGPIHESERHPS